MNTFIPENGGMVKLTVYMLNDVCTTQTYTIPRKDNGGIVKLAVRNLNDVCTNQTCNSQKGRQW